MRPTKRIIHIACTLSILFSVGARGADGLPNIGIRSGTGNDFAGAFDLGTISTDIDATHTASTFETFNHYGASPNDVFYRFVLTKPMLVTFDHFGSQVPGTRIYLVKLGVTDDFDISLSEMQCRQDWDYALSHFSHMDYEKAAFSQESASVGILFDFLEPGTYYLIGERTSSNAGSKGGIIQTNFHFHTIPGASAESPLQIGTFSEEADTTLTFIPEQFPLAEKRSALYLTASFNNHFNAIADGVYAGIDVIDKNGSIVYSSNSPGNILEMEIKPERYLFRLSYISQSTEPVILHIAGARTTPEGSSIDTPIPIGTFQQDFNIRHDILSGMFYFFRTNSSMEVSLSCSTHGRLSLYRGHTLIRESASGMISFKTMPAGTYILSNDTGTVGNYNSLTITGRTLQGGEHFTESASYICTYEPFKSVSSAESLSSDNSRITIIYHDGIGRPVETIRHQNSPSSADIVSLMEYDRYGRPSKSWKDLPYLNNGAAVNVNAVFFESADFHGDSTAYTDFTYDALDRKAQITGPGQHWREAGSALHHSYRLNRDGECRRFLLSETKSLIDAGFYPAGTLNVETRIDENWNKSELYTDGRGNLILERKFTVSMLFPEEMNSSDEMQMDTYYVFDDLCRLHYVLPPEASASGNLKRATEDYAFIYRYGPAGLNTWKRIPGKSWDRFIYGMRREAVGKQDSTMRARGVFQLTVPDNLGRPAVTAFVEDRFPKDLETADLRAVPDSSRIGYRWADSSVMSRFSLPQIQDLPEILSVNYYDNYDYRRQIPDTRLKASSYVRPANATSLLTGALTLSFPDKDTIISAVYYDDLKRPIQQREILPEEIAHFCSFDYDFIGNVTRSRETVQARCISDTLVHEISYDHAGRVIEDRSQLNGSKQATVSYSYDEIGRADEMTYSAGWTPLRIRSTFNIRDWMMSIQSSMFNMELNYDKPATKVIPHPMSGDISDMSWSYLSNKSRTGAYIFRYDALSRLTEALPFGDYYHRHEEFMGYDRNGNIRVLNRRERRDTAYLMEFNYNGNRVFSASLDNCHAIENVQFSYDAEGRLIHDGANGLELSYSRIGRIQDISGDGTTLARYSYSADGRKLSAIDRYGNGLIYVGSLVYRKQDGSTRFDSAPFSHGRFVFRKDRIEPHYFITDHIGSVRVEVGADGDIVEINDYYPSGAIWKDMEERPAGDYANRYRFNGKEEQSFLGLPYIDYGARMYNPENMMSWLTADEMAEEYHSMSPYSFCAGNPVNIIDPDGRRIFIRHFLDENSSSSAVVEYSSNKRCITKHDFIRDVWKQLDNIYNYGGKKAMDRLLASKNKYYINDRIGAGGNMQFKASETGGFIFAGAIEQPSYEKSLSIESLAHELFHALQHDEDLITNGYNTDATCSVQKEIEAYAFSSIIYSNYKPTMATASQDSISGEKRGAILGTRYKNAFNAIVSDPNNVIPYFNKAVRSFKTGSRVNKFRIYKGFKKIRGYTPTLLIDYYPTME